MSALTFFGYPFYFFLYILLCPLFGEKHLIPTTTYNISLLAIIGSSGIERTTVCVNREKSTISIASYHALKYQLTIQAPSFPLSNNPSRTSLEQQAHNRNESAAVHPSQVILIQRPLHEKKPLTKAPLPSSPQPIHQTSAPPSPSSPSSAKAMLYTQTRPPTNAKRTSE
jgi:hypothetical protein